jgi:putative peptidoglycan lipid II flippase
VEVLRERTSAALERVAFYVVPSFVAFVAVGDLLVAALFQRGEFDRSNTLLVYFVLVGYSLGLLASTGTRLFSSAFFALRDTRTPARIATLRVAIGAVLGLVLMLQFEQVSFDLSAGRCGSGAGSSGTCGSASGSSARWAWRAPPPSGRGWSGCCCAGG